MFGRALCLFALLTAAGCAGLDEGYTTHYGLTSTEQSSTLVNPVDETYIQGAVGIQEMEEYEEKYYRKDILSEGESEEPTE